MVQLNSTLPYLHTGYIWIPYASISAAGAPPGVPPALWASMCKKRWIPQGSRFKLSTYRDLVMVDDGRDH